MTGQYYSLNFSSDQFDGPYRSVKAAKEAALRSTHTNAEISIVKVVESGSIAVVPKTRSRTGNKS